MPTAANGISFPTDLRFAQKAGRLTEMAHCTSSSRAARARWVHQRSAHRARAHHRPQRACEQCREPATYPQHPPASPLCAGSESLPCAYKPARLHYATTGAPPLCANRNSRRAKRGPQRRHAYSRGRVRYCPLLLPPGTVAYVSPQKFEYIYPGKKMISG